MAYIILSDIHSNISAFKAVLNDIGSVNFKEILCAGDIVGYGAYPDRCIEMVRELSIKSVMGNHDAAVVGKTDITYFNTYAREAALWTEDRLTMYDKEYLSGLPYKLNKKNFTVVHGTLHHPKEFMYMMTGADAMHTFEILKKKICFVGHSHVPGVFVLRRGKVYQSTEATVRLEDGAKYIVNVGSVGQPRDGDNRACYCVLDEEKKYIEIRRVRYDVQAAKDAIIDAGLPPMLGERLLSGR